MLLRKNDHVLFFGDSLTDSGRRNPQTSNDGLGNGYVWWIVQHLREHFGELELTFTNRGIGGDRVEDLQDRLQQDVLDLQPTVVSILIGINNVWRFRSKPDEMPPISDFQARYRQICTAIRNTLGARLILMEPYVLHTPADRHNWRILLNPQIDAIRELAVECADLFVPLDGPFAAAMVKKPLEQWATDGVHLTEEGAKLIARQWLDAVGGDA
jgi:lysophospholipase L1-like esterase